METSDSSSINDPSKTRNAYSVSRYRGVIVGIIFLAGSIFTFWSLQTIQKDLVQKVAYDHSSKLSNTLTQFRTLYTSEVISKAKAFGMEVSHDYKDNSAAIPLPATLSILLGEAITSADGGGARLYSDYPFPWRENSGGVRDSFEQEALEFFRESPYEREFYRIESYQGRLSLRYAAPDRMRESCVGCHNSHPDTPRNDWRVGDVRGVLEVIVPMNVAYNAIGNGLQRVWIIMGGLGGGSLLFLWFTNQRFRKQSTIIDQGTIALKKEIDDRLKAQREKEKIEVLANRLRESEAKMRSIVESAAESIVTITSENRIITTFNPAAEITFGYESKHIIGKDFSLLTPEDSDINEFFLPSENKANNAVAIDELIGYRQDGTAFPMSMSVSPMGIKGQESYTIIIRDLTEKKALEAKLLQAQKLESVGQLAAGIAHEINTPIQFIGDNLVFAKDAILDISELIKKYQRFTDKNIDQDSEEMIKEIKDIKETEERIDIEFTLEEAPKSINESLEGVARVAKIVRAMKEFSHPGSETMEMSDINSAIENTIVIAQNEWRYVANLETNLYPDLPLIPCFLNEFNQVILNLIVNAAHAISDALPEGEEEKGVINISTSIDGHWALIEVSDTGPGIPEKIISKVFDPFFTTKEVGKGTGQGLSIAHRVITEKHSGELDVTSKIGKGTTFSIRLPIHPTEQN